MPARALLVAVVLALAGCPSPRADDVPDGFTLYSGNGYSFAYPADWELRDGEAVSEPTRDVEVEGPEGSGGMSPGIVASSSQGLPAELGIDDVVAQFNLNAERNQLDRRVVAEERREVSGAEDARLLESRYALPLNDGGEVEVRQFDLLVLVGDGGTVHLGAGGPADDIDEAQLRTVLDSLRVDG